MSHSPILNDVDLLCSLLPSNPREPGLNVTKTVRVPSSEHVAEIVGRQGCKIKAIRATTNTYIKTPVRGSEPTFHITGREEDVEKAVTDIETAAIHFTELRSFKPQSSEGQVVGYVRVPYKVVGLIVGQRGNTIKRIQQVTNTYIVTPSREKEPVFEITGIAVDVESAFDEIKTHVRIRTGVLEDDEIDSILLTLCEIEETDSVILPEPPMTPLESPIYQPSWDSMTGHWKSGYHGYSKSKYLDYGFPGRFSLPNSYMRFDSSPGTLESISFDYSFGFK